MTIFSELFPKSSRGKQLIPTCYAALMILFVFGILCFSDYSVDAVLSYGDRLFTYVKRNRKEQILRDNRKNLSEDEIDWLLEHEEFRIEDVPNKVSICKFLVCVNVEPEVVIGDINAQNFEDVFDIKRGLEKFFQTYSYGILQAKGNKINFPSNNLEFATFTCTMYKIPKYINNKFLACDTGSLRQRQI